MKGITETDILILQDKLIDSKSNFLEYQLLLLAGIAVSPINRNLIKFLKSNYNRESFKSQINFMRFQYLLDMKIKETRSFRGVKGVKSDPMSVDPIIVALKGSIFPYFGFN